MTFLDMLLSAFNVLRNTFGNGITLLLNFISKPLMYLLEFLEGIFYLITMLFNLVINVISLFTALFQFIFAVGKGFTSSMYSLANLSSGQVQNISLENYIEIGFSALTDHLWPTGFMTIVPYVTMGIIFIAFAYKVLDLGHKEGGKKG